MTPRNRTGPPEAGFSEPARACQSLPEPARACQSLPEPARACQSLPEPARACQSLPEPARACQSLPEPARACQSLPKPARASEPARACQSQEPARARACQSLPEPARARQPELPERVCQSLCRSWEAPPKSLSGSPSHGLPELAGPGTFSGAFFPISQSKAPSKASPGFQEPPGLRSLLRAFWVQGVFLPEVLFRPLAQSTRQFFPQLSLFLKHFVLPVRMLLGQIPHRFPHLTGRFQLYSKITTIRVLRTLQRFRRRTSPMAAKS